MIIPHDVNTRAQEMWAQITIQVNFTGKSVIDLGCGTGDFLWRTQIAGATRVVGYDIDLSRVDKKRAQRTPLIQGDLNLLPKDDSIIEKPYDIALCFSVIPYLKEPLEFIKWMAANFPICILEVQSPPEPYTLGLDESALFALFLNHFDKVHQLGYTTVKDRETRRYLWRCEND